MTIRVRPRALSIVFLLFAVGTASGQYENREFHVYEYVVESASGSLHDVTNAIKTAAASQGWEVLSSTDAGVPADCDFAARVIALHHPVYARELMGGNSPTAPFAVVDRINVFEDEAGLHVSVVNPHSTNRTVLMDDMTYAELTEAHLQALRMMIASAVNGGSSNQGYGQARARGRIGKTMGVMAGGDFVDQIQDIAVLPGAEVSDVAARVRNGLSKPGSKWDLQLAYELTLPSGDAILFGSTGREMERKSFSIVGAGSNKDRRDLRCPGLAHAAAYPLEILVKKDGDDVKVQFVAAMYRMKMFFEDAGKTAFMKNMGMPGSIADEIKDQIRPALDGFAQ